MNNVDVKNLFSQLNFKVTETLGRHCKVENKELNLSLTMKANSEPISSKMLENAFDKLFLASHIYETNMLELDGISPEIKTLISKKYRDLAKGTLQIIPEDVKTTNGITNEKSASKYVKEARSRVEDFSM